VPISDTPQDETYTSQKVSTGVRYMYQKAKLAEEKAKKMEDIRGNASKIEVLPPRNSSLQS
jgi:hypothetical protein